MSFDVKIQNICDHKISLERTSLESDSVTIRTQHYISSISAFQLYRFGALVNRSDYAIVPETDPAFSFLYPKKVIKFYKKDRATRPLYEVNYITVSNDCPKCGGVKFLDDPVLGSDGDYRTVENEDLLAQFVQKYVITEINSNKYHLWIGTSLVSLTTIKIQDINFIKLKIQEEIRKTLDNLKQLQKQQIGTTQQVSLGEQLDRILSITVTGSSDPTILNVTVEYKSIRGGTLEFIQGIQMSQLSQQLVSA